MSRRALISLLVFLTGTGAVPAEPLVTGKKNLRFQPGKAVHPAVLRPAQVKVGASDPLLAGVTVQKINPVARLPAKVEIGRTELRAPAEARIQPAVQPAAANH